MSKHTDKGKGFLKEKLGGYQADPPPGVWESISANLGGRNRRGMLIVLLAAASVALAVSLGITYFGRDIPQDLGLAEGQENSIHTLPELSKSFDEPASPDKKILEPVPTSQKPGLEEKVVQTLTKVARVEVSTTEAEEAQASLAVSRSEKEELPFDIPTPTHREVMKTEEEIPDFVDLSLEEGVGQDQEMLKDFENELEKDPRWVLGAMLSPLYSFRDAEPDALAGTSGQESGMISYATGVQFGYRATRRLAVETGIIFNKMGVSIGAPGIQVFSDPLDNAFSRPEIAKAEVMAITNSVGNIVSHTGDIFVNNYMLNASSETNSIDDVYATEVSANQGIRQHLDYLEVPINLRYTLREGSFRIQILGGMSTNLLVNNYVTMETSDGTTEIGYLSNVRNVNYSGNAGIGFVYHFLDQLSLNIEPRFRYYLNSVNDATLPSTRPYTFGIYTGLNYFF